MWKRIAGLSPSGNVGEARTFVVAHLTARGLLQPGWQKVAANWSQLVVRNLVSLGIAIAASSVIARSLERSDYGMVQYVLGMAATLSILSLPGFSTVLTQEVALGNDSAIYDVMRRRLLSSSLMCLVLLAMAAYVAIVTAQPSMAMAFVVAALASPVAYSIDVTGFLVAKRDYHRLSMYPMAAQACIAATTIVAALTVHDAIAIVAANFLTQALYAIVTYWLVLRAYSPKYRVLNADARRFGVRLTGASLVASVTYRVDMLIVGAFIGLPELAVLALGRQFYDKMRLVMEPVTTLFVPRLYAHSRREAYMFSLKVLLAVSILLGAAVTVLSLAMPWVFRLLYPGYLDAVPYAVALLFAYVLSVPNTIFQNLLNYERRAGQVARSLAISNGLYLVSLPFLLMAMGVWGVVVARYVLNIGSSVVSGFFVLRNWLEVVHQPNETSTEREIS